MVEFADDVALFVIAKDIEELEYLGNDAIEVVTGWLFRHGLTLAGEKTEAVVIARTKRSYATLTVEGKKIRSMDKIKYLGITIDA